MRLPEMTLNDATRTSFMMMVRAIFPVLVILGVPHTDPTESVIIMAFIESVLAFLANLFKQGQGV